MQHWGEEIAAGPRVYHLHAIWSSDLMPYTTADISYNISAFKIAHSHKIGNISQFHSFTPAGSGFSGPLDWMEVEPGRSKCFLTTIKLRWCVFSHISLFPNAVMLHSFGVTLILFWKIPLIFDVARNTKKMKMLSGVKNTDPIFYVLTLRYPGPECRAC